MPHILFHTSGGDKIIFVVGYGNKRKWKDALGGQYGCLYIDEINTADIEFVRESAMRSDYLMATLNPDDPESGCVQRSISTVPVRFPNGRTRRRRKLEMN